MTYDLILLRAAAIAAIEAARAHTPRIAGAIKWDRLTCIIAELWVSDDDSTGYRVWLLDAEPDCRELHQFIAAHLAAAGFADIEVITEW